MELLNINKRVKATGKYLDHSQSETKLFNEELKADDGTFLTSLKGQKKRVLRVDNSETIDDDQKALVLFGAKDSFKSKMKRTSSTSTLDNIQLKNLKKPPIYLPELRDRRDVWKGKSSGDLLAQSKPGVKKKKPFDPMAHLRAGKNWFLVPQKNVLLCLSDQDLNDELKNMNKRHKSQAEIKTEQPKSLAEEKYEKHKYKSKVKLGDAITHLKDLKKNCYSQKEHTFRVMHRENTPWCQTEAFYPSFENKKDAFIQKYQVLLDYQEMLEKRISGKPYPGKQNPLNLCEIHFATYRNAPEKLLASIDKHRT